MSTIRPPLIKPSLISPPLIRSRVPVPPPDTPITPKLMTIPRAIAVPKPRSTPKLRTVPKSLPIRVPRAAPKPRDAPKVFPTSERVTNDQIKSLLEQLNEIKHLYTQDQIKVLSNLPDTNGKFLFRDPDQRSLIYNIFAQAQSYTGDKVYKSIVEFDDDYILTTEQYLNGDLKQLPPSKWNLVQEVFLNTPGLVRAQDHHQLEIDNKKAKQGAEEGIYKCSRCSSKETIYFQTQTRSGDEGMTTTVHCLNCGNHWFD